MKMKRKINKAFIASPKLRLHTEEKDDEKVDSDSSSGWSTIASMASTISSTSPLSRKTKQCSHHFWSPSPPPPPPPPPPPQYTPKRQRKTKRSNSLVSSPNGSKTPTTNNNSIPQTTVESTEQDVEKFVHYRIPDSSHRDDKTTVIIQSKKSITSLEVEHGSSSTSSRPKMPWRKKLKQQTNHNNKYRNDVDETRDHYHAMEEDGVFREPPLTHSSARFPPDPSSNDAPRDLVVAAHDYFTNDDDDPNLKDFRESDWTPQDSSYGAAIPVAGWIPKHIRRMIESTLILVGAAGLVYLIVTTSIRVTGDNGSSNTSRHYNGSINGTNNNNLDQYYAFNGDDVQNSNEYSYSSSSYNPYKNNDNNDAQQGKGEGDDIGDDYYN